MPGDRLHGMNIKMEAFHQLVLASQRAVKVVIKNYRKSKIVDISNAKVVVIRKRYDQEVQKCLPTYHRRQKAGQVNRSVSACFSVW